MRQGDGKGPPRFWHAPRHLRYRCPTLLQLGFARLLQLLSRSGAHISRFASQPLARGCDNIFACRVARERWHCVGGSKLAWQRVSGLANSRAAEQNGLGLNVYGGASNWHCHPSVCAVQLLLLLSYCNSTCLYIRVAEGRQKYHQYPIFNIINHVVNHVHA